MKTFRVTVNGNTYDVQVEELEAGISVPPTPAVAPPSVAQPAVKQQSKVAEGVIKVSAPMPGTILDIKVSVGATVSKNQTVIILEAMKMENEVVTPSAGKIESINVSKGDTVNSGDLLLTVS